MVGRTAQSGYIALMGVLVIGAVATATALTLLVISADSQRSTLIEQQSTQAHGLAVACGEEALQQMQENTAYTGSGNLTLGQGSCTYTVTNTGGTGRSILSTGTVGNLLRKIQIGATIGTSNISITSWQDVN